MRFNWRGFYGIVVLSATVLTVGCGNNDSSYVRTVNASNGLTGYTVQVGQTGVVSSLPYGTEGVQPKGNYATVDTSGNYRPIADGTNQKVIVYQKPGTPPLASATQSFLNNSYYTIVTLSPAPGINILALTDDNSAPTSGQFKLRAVQAAPSAGAVDVYLTAPGASLSGATPVLSNFLFGQVTQTYFQLAPGTYEVQVTPHNSANALIQTTFSPAAGNVYTAFALDPPTGSTNFSLLVTHDPVATSTTMSSGTGH